MTLHNITTQAHAVNRDLAADDERDRIVAWLRQCAQASDEAADVLRLAADTIENGHHRR